MIRKHLKHWLVPHQRNDHRPHLIRRGGLIAIAVAIVALQVGWNASVGELGHVLGYATDISTSNLFDQTNQQRAAQGLEVLRMDARLNNAAAAKAQDMFAKDYWAHASPTGVQPWYWFGQAGYDYSYAGENLAKGFATTSGVIDGWMNSPEHRANLLNVHYSDVGFAVASGTLQGEQTTLVVALYGAPVVGMTAASVAAAPAAAAKSVPVTPVVPAATALPTEAPVPANTPAATPVISTAPTSRLTTTSTVSPLSQATLAPTTTASYSLFRPLAITRTLGWGALMTLLLLGLLFTVFTVTHLAVWRKGLRRWHKHHYRMWAAAELAGIGAIIVLTLSAGFGSVH